MQLARRILVSIAMLLLFSEAVWAIGSFKKIDVFGGVTPVPIIFDYATCTARYRFCSCRLTGLSNPEDVLERFDKDRNGRLSYQEMHLAINSGVFSDEELGDTKFLACWFEPPSPGPYSRERCLELFGEDDCLCANRWPQGAYCYSRSAVLLSPEQIPVPKDFCKTVNGQPVSTTHLNNEGFDCRCPETITTPAIDSPSLDNCYVNPPDADVDYECFDEIRIFPGDLYVCIDDTNILGSVQYEHCCPDDIDCALEEHNSGFDYMGTALFVTNAGLKFYTAWRGYEAIWGSQGSLAQFLTHVVGNPGEALRTVSKIGGLPGAEVFSSFLSSEHFFSKYSAFESYMGMGEYVMGGTFTALSSALNYTAMAYSIFKMGASIIRKTCSESDYALACKVRARLCINAGRCKRKKHAGLTVIKKEVWICYNSQIARVINEYGLPQLYAPGCHQPNCSAASVDRKRKVHRTNCGCEAAYTEDGFGKCKYSSIKDRVRYRGFTPEQFKRLDFDKIPLAEELSYLLLAENEDFVSGALDPSAVWQDYTSPVNQPSAFETERAEESASEVAETARDITDTPPGNAQVIGTCPSSFPVTASEAENYTPSGVFRLDLCVKPKIDYHDDPELAEDFKVRRFYLVLFGVARECTECSLSGIDPLSDSCPDCRNVSHHYECISTARQLGIPEEIAMGFQAFNKEISVSTFKDCVAVKHWRDGGFFRNGGLPPLPPPAAWSDFYFYKTTPAGPEKFSFLKRSEDPENPHTPAFYIAFVNSISETGFNRGKYLSNAAGCLFYKDRLPESPCTHIECGRFAIGEEDQISPACLQWINDVLNAFYATVDENCRIVQAEGHNSWGKKWLHIKNFSVLSHFGSFTEGRDYFCSCPSYSDDICLVERGVFPEMVCPRPSRVNLVERIRVNLRDGGYHDTYINLPNYRRDYCWIDPLVADSCPCN